jgi:hypothetical protein
MIYLIALKIYLEDLAMKLNKSEYIKNFIKNHPKQRKAAQKRYRNSHKEQIKEFYQNHKEEIKKKQHEYYLKNKIKILKRNKKYYLKNKQEINCKIAENYYNKRKNDINFKILCNLRTRLWRALKGKVKKSKHTTQLLGCSIEELKQHLEKQFTKGMAWENYGKWEIDHIIPCYSFDLTKEEEQCKCFKYTNLQPLWETDNIRKSRKICVC